jgi:hypothetical protein
VSKYLRDLKRIAEDEGYTYEGYAGGDSSGPGSGHHVFTHQASGAVVRTSSTPKSESNTLKNARGQFRRTAKTTDSKAAAFRAFMLKKYKVGRNGSKVVHVTVRDLVDEFNLTRPSDPINAGHVTVMFGQDPMFERLDFQVGGGTRGSSVTTLRISGPTYGLVKEADAPVIAEDPCGATFQTPSQGIAVCVLEAGHAGLHYDSFRKTRWAEGSGVTVAAVSEPVIDPVAQKAAAALPKMAEQLAAQEPTQTPAPPVLEPVSVGGMTLSDELADQLREALGVPDAAMAVESKDAAIKALTQAQDALQMALDAINGVVVRVPTLKRHKEPSQIGPIQRNRLDMIKQAGLDGRLNERFTVAEVMAMLGISEGQAVSTLARGQRDADTVRRVAQSTYELR